MKRAKQAERKVATLEAINGALQAENDRLRVSTGPSPSEGSLREEFARRVAESEAKWIESRKNAKMLQARVDALEREAKDAKAEADLLRERNASMEHERERERVSLSQAAESAQSQAREAHRAMSALEEELLSRARKAEREKEAYESERREQEQRSVQETQPLLSEIQSLQKQVAALQGSIQDAEHLAEQRHEKLERNKRELMQRSSQLERCEASKKELERREEEARRALETIRLELESTRAERQSLATRLQSVQEQLHVSTERLSASSERISRLEQEVSECKESLRVATRISETRSFPRETMEVEEIRTNFEIDAKDSKASPSISNGTEVPLEGTQATFENNSLRMEALHYSGTMPSAPERRRPGAEASLRKELATLRRTHIVALELLGERNERVEQLEEDVRDLKDLLRVQAEAFSRTLDGHSPEDRKESSKSFKDDPKACQESLPSNQNEE